MRELLAATKNPGKFKEIKEALYGALFKLIFLGDLRVNDGDFVEDGRTFDENAYKKAQYYFAKTGIMTLAEDSGILVDALGGELGVRTRRWGAGQSSSDQEWIDYFMKRMENVPPGCRGAKFVCHACIIGNGFVKKFFGETRGKISRKLEAPVLPGIPLSSCFKPDGFEKVYAALSVEEKNLVSHRGKAMAGVKDFLINFKA